MELDRMYKTILDNMNEQVYVRDLDMNILYINPASERLSGWSVAEAMGKKCYEVFGDEDLACKAVCPVNKAISERLSIHHHEGKLKTWSGDAKDMQVSISPLYEGEDVTGAVVVMEDISRLREVEQTHVKTLIALEKENKERKRTEKKLRRSEKRYSLATKAANVGVWEWNVKTGEFYLDPNIKALLGYRDEEIPNDLDSWATYIHPDDKEPVMKAFQDHMAGKTPVLLFEHRMLHKDSSIRWIMVRGTAHRDAQGVVDYVVGTDTDITESRQAETAINKFFEQPMNLHIIAGLDGFIHRVNEGWKTFLGYSKNELEGTYFYDLVHPDDLDSTADEMKDLGRGETTFCFENRYRHKDGTYRFLAWSAKASLRGQLVYAVASDITERKQAETEMRKSNEKYRSLVESTDDSIYLMSQDLTYLFMNRSHLSPYGGESEKVIGRNYAEFHSENATRDFANRVQAVFETGRALTYEYKSERDGGYYLRSLSPVKGQDGKIQSITVISRKITKQKRAEESLKKSETRLRNMSIRMEEVTESERKRLTRELHDRVGQNLSALNLNLSIMRSQLSEKSKEKMVARLDDATVLLEETTTHIRDVMNDLRPEVLDDYGLTAALRWYAERFSERTGLLTEVKSKALSSRPAHIDELILFRITQEALTNVYKHAQAGRAVVTLEQLEDKLRLTIADDGLGFDPTGLKTSKQSGWGLVIMKERAMAIGGRFQIETGPGMGTKVIVEVIQ